MTSSKFWDTPTSEPLSAMHTSPTQGSDKQQTLWGIFIITKTGLGIKRDPIEGAELEEDDGHLQSWC